MESETRRSQVQWAARPDLCRKEEDGINSWLISNTQTFSFHLLSFDPVPYLGKLMLSTLLDSVFEEPLFTRKPQDLCFSFSHSLLFEKLRWTHSQYPIGRWYPIKSIQLLRLTHRNAAYGDLHVIFVLSRLSRSRFSHPTAITSQSFGCFCWETAFVAPLRSYLHFLFVSSRFRRIQLETGAREFPGEPMEPSNDRLWQRLEGSTNFQRDLAHGAL